MSKEIRIECLTEIFETLGIAATKEQIEQVEKDFLLHIEMENELSSYQHAGFKQECSKCKSLEHELNEVKIERDVYQNSVKRRRNADRVWIEGDLVKYD